MVSIDNMDYCFSAWYEIDPISRDIFCSLRRTLDKLSIVFSVCWQAQHYVIPDKCNFWNELDVLITVVWKEEVIKNMKEFIPFFKDWIGHISI